MAERRRSGSALSFRPTAAQCLACEGPSAEETAAEQAQQAKYETSLELERLQHPPLCRCECRECVASAASSTTCTAVPSSARPPPAVRRRGAAAARELQQATGYEPREAKHADLNITSVGGGRVALSIEGRF